MTAKSGQNYINHIALVLDASASMQSLASKVVKVTDDLVAFLADKSKKDNEETRITVYSFSDEAECHIWDMDVFRLPSIKGLYKIKYSTALIDAVHLVLDDLSTVPEKYGDHDFMAYVLTDGQENVSRGKQTPQRGFYGRVPSGTLTKELRDRLDGLPANVTMLGLAPDDTAARYMYRYGFAEGNVALWDASTEEGLETAVERIKEAHTSYVATRTLTGVRGTKSAFVVGDNVDKAHVKAANLKPLANSTRQIVPVVKTPEAYEHKTKGWVVEIKPFVDYAHPPYRVGRAFYQLVKREKIQGDKAIAVVEKSTSKVFVGDGARQLVGLPDHEVAVTPGQSADYDIYVQSSSVNRQLQIGTKVLLLTK